MIKVVSSCIAYSKQRSLHLTIRLGTIHPPVTAVIDQLVGRFLISQEPSTFYEPGILWATDAKTKKHLEKIHTLFSINLQLKKKEQNVDSQWHCRTTIAVMKICTKLIRIICLPEQWSEKKYILCF